MKRFLSSLFIVVWLSVAGFLFWQNHRTEAQIVTLQERLSVVTAENGQLTKSLPKQTNTATATDESVHRSLEKAVEDIHLLKFKQPIRFRTMKSGDFKNFMIAEINKVYSKEELDLYGRAMALLGLVPDGTDIGKTILRLYDEQVAAFYDQHKGELYTFSDFSLSENIDRVMLAHEMTHALQDQNFDLKRFPLERKDNDDLNLASSALIEGDATLLMTLWYMQHLSEGFDLGSVVKDLGSMLAQNTEQLQAAPAYFRQTLLFPYQQGNDFAMALYTQGGYGEINKAFARPPVSTTQILHPEKFLKHEDPIEVRFPVLNVNGWKPAFTNVVGELGTRILLEQYVTAYEADRAADGWGGDRYVAFDDGHGKLAVAWVSVWVSDSDAREFEESIDAAEHKRLGQATVKQAADETGYLKYGSDGFYVAIRKSGTQVTVILGPKEDVLKVISAAGKQARDGDASRGAGK